VASIPPHIHTQPSEAEANPTPDPNQDAIARIPLARSPLAAFLGIICSLAALGSLWFGRSAVVVAAGLAAAGIVLAIIGNAAEIIAATYFARQNRMDLVMGLCLGSSVQVALLMAPTLVLISHFLGHPMNLIFSNPLELIAIVGMVFVVNSIAADGETTWFEGVLLVAVYALLAIAFYFATP